MSFSGITQKHFPLDYKLSMILHVETLMNAMKKIDGSACAKAARHKLQEAINLWVLEGKKAPHLAIVQVGNKKDSQLFIKNKNAACRKVGIETSLYHLTQHTTQKQVMDCINYLNKDPAINGILLQLPLPKQLDQNQLMHTIDPTKDVDGFHPHSMGQLMLNQPRLETCVSKGIIHLMTDYKIKLKGKHCVIVGASNTVGKPIALAMAQKQATITLCNHTTKHLQSLVEQADIIVTAIGKKHIVNASWFKKNAILIDVGIHIDRSGTVSGDVILDEKSQCAWYTPVPGGVGPMTVWALLDNTWIATQQQAAT